MLSVCFFIRWKENSLLFYKRDLITHYSPVPYVLVIKIKLVENHMISLFL